MTTLWGSKLCGDGSTRPTRKRAVRIAELRESLAELEKEMLEALEQEADGSLRSAPAGGPALIRIRPGRSTVTEITGKDGPMLLMSTSCSARRA